ncbi:MAG: hypothetical protein KIPDCIKN_02061 [Haliscomenobacter sp.]|nr:hypothetical protein [Haliscomenobacter sp.]
MKYRFSLLAMLLFLLPALAFSQVVLEDFEGGAKLTWNAIEGSFTVADNPAGGDTLKINSSAKVGQYTKKSGAAYSLFLTELAAPLDLSVNNQFRIMVKAPVATAFIMKLEGPGFGIEQTKNIAVANQWIEYTFNFSAAKAKTNLNKILLFFDPGVDASSDTYLFDNIVAGPSGACDGIAVNPSILDDFECQRNISYGIVGLTDYSVVDNPDKSGLNTSDKVGRYRDTLGEWHAFVLDYGNDVPLADRSVFKMKLWAPKKGKLLVKMEGTGGQKEIFVDVNDTLKWVEITADFTSEVGKKYQRIALFFNAGVLPGASDIYFFDDVSLNAAPKFLVLEDFEGGAKLPWNPIDGTYAVIDNPAGGDTLQINTGGKVGSYTKKQGAGYSLFLAELAQPLNLTTFNQFRIMVKAERPTSFILKLENANNSKSIEEKRNIAVTGQWIEYTFNFSKVKDVTDLKKILLFFDPGVDTSGGTYLFDNLIIEPTGACSGVEKNISMLDDFECQRNATYGAPGYNDVKVVANPDKSSANDSEKVGEYNDRTGEWHALVIDNDGANLAIADRPVVKIKVWAPVAGTLKFKMEGTGGNKEIDRQVTEIKKWVEYTADFTSEAGKAYQKLVFFFNAGKLPGADTIYYIDDIRMEAPGSVTLEDFEPTPKQTWESLGAEAVFGKFNGGINNPDKTGANTTDKVGSYTKGSSKLGGLKALLPLSFSLADFPQMNLQVWAPAGAKTLTMKLISVVDGTKEINRPIAETGKWVDLSFNFDNVKTITDFERVEIVFDPDLESTATWYFDNLTQTKATVDPCEGVTPSPYVIDDFDCQRNAKAFLSTDPTTLEVVRNPFPEGINSSANDKVLKYVDPAGAKEWSAIVWDMGKEFDLTSYNSLAIKIYATKAGPVLFKLEGGTQEEVFGEIKAGDVGKWVEYQVSFKAAAGKKNTKFVLFFNAGKQSTEGDTYYVDDIEWRREPYTGCVTTFETPADNLGTWQYFAAAAREGKRFDVVVDNPKKSALNSSNKVGEFVEEVGGNPWLGMFNDQLPAQVHMGTNKKMTMKVWMDHEAEVVFKVERSPNGGPNIGDAIAMYTTPGEWQTLTWNYPVLNPTWNIPDGTIYTTFSIIMDLKNQPATEKRYYFDDIAIGDATCGTSTPTRDLQVEPLSIYPNPATDELTVDNSVNLTRYELFNAVGQRVGTFVITGQASITIPLNGLDRGMYLLAGYDRQGVLRANARFVKQ